MKRDFEFFNRRESDALAVIDAKVLQSALPSQVTMKTMSDGWKQIAN